jgi:transcriptional regulator with PAS, ATPase and Fis domain
VDVRVLAATNKNPSQAVADGHLRADLFYRLNVFNIHMPPLREHKEDIPAIVESMIEDMNRKHDRHISGVDSGMMQRLMACDWPGNVRELRNTVERAVVLGGDGLLEARHLPHGFGVPIERPPESASSENAVSIEVGSTIDEAERRLILKTLESHGNNKTRAAETLGISLKTLHNKLKEYGNSVTETADEQ